MTHRQFWSNKTVISIYEELAVTCVKVIDLLVLPEAKSVAESRVYGYLTTMVGNMNTDKLRSLLWFITGNSVCSATEILVTFNSLSGLGRRPIAHTCDCILELSTEYMNYEDFYGEFQAILSKVNTHSEWMHFNHSCYLLMESHSLMITHLIIHVIIHAIMHAISLGNVSFKKKNNNKTKQTIVGLVWKYIVMCVRICLAHNCLKHQVGEWLPSVPQCLYQKT